LGKSVGRYVIGGAGERGELPSGEPEVASPVEQRSTATA
jgi:hypothetical protein